MELKLKFKNPVLSFNLGDSVLQLAPMIEGLLAIMLFHSAGPLYVIDDCKYLELKRGITTEFRILDGYRDVFLLMIL